MYRQKVGLLIDWLNCTLKTPGVVKHYYSELCCWTPVFLGTWRCMSRYSNRLRQLYGWWFGLNATHMISIRNVDRWNAKHLSCRHADARQVCNGEQPKQVRELHGSTVAELPASSDASALSFSPIVLTGKVNQTAASVCPSVRPSVSNLSFELTDLWTWDCLCMGHGRSSSGIESQGQRLIKRSVWPRSAIGDSFSSFTRTLISETSRWRSAQLL